MRFKQRRKTNHHSSKPRPEAPPAAPPGQTTATPPTPPAPTPEANPEPNNRFALLDALPTATLQEVASFSNQMLRLLTERKRRLDLLLSTILHPTSSIKLKLFALKSIGKIPYFRFRKRDHTDPYLLGYIPQLKAFNRELLDTFIFAQQCMTDLLESGKLTTKDYLLVLGELSKLPIPNLRMQDHCDNPIPSLPSPSPSNKPTTEAPAPAAQAQTDPDANTETDANDPDPTDHTEADTDSENVQIVQNGQIVQTAHDSSDASNSPTDSELTLAHC